MAETVDAAEQLGHDALRLAAAGDRVAVGAVGADQVVGVAHRADGADDRRLLTDRQMQEPADLGAGVLLAGTLLEPADEQHCGEPFLRDCRIRKGTVSHRVGH